MGSAFHLVVSPILALATERITANPGLFDGIDAFHPQSCG